MRHNRFDMPMFGLEGFAEGLDLGFRLGQGLVLHDGACCGDHGGVVFGLADVDPKVELVVHGGHLFSSRWGRVRRPDSPLAHIHVTKPLDGSCFDQWSKRTSTGPGDYTACDHR